MDGILMRAARELESLRREYEETTQLLQTGILSSRILHKRANSKSGYVEGATN